MVEPVEDNPDLESKLPSALLNTPQISESIASGQLEKPRIQFVGPGEITRTGRIEQRIIDECESS